MTNEPLKQLFIDTVKETKEGIAKAVDIVMAEMPELCAQIIQFEIVKNSIACVGLVLILGAPLYAGRKILKDGDECTQSLCVFPFMLSIFPLIGLYHCLSIVIKAWIAPKLFLIEYAAQLFK